MQRAVTDWIGRNIFRPPVFRLASPYLARPHGRGGGLRVRVYFDPNRISFSQIFPFIDEARAFRQSSGAVFRFEPMARFLDPAARMQETDVAIIQPWFDVSPDALTNALDRFGTVNPASRLIFFDSFAHNDLRLGRVLSPYIDTYVKKSLFKDRDAYFRTTRGDTNLTDYYNTLYGIPADPVDWQVPHGILPKLRLGPNFFTAPGLVRGFASEPRFAERPIDVHARLGGTGGKGWYGEMRRDSLKKLTAIPGIKLTGTDSVDWNGYIAEMRQSKLCFSPFGYGELCWRDIEAFMTGAVLVKPDMSHLETLPDLYEANVTYAPVNWDFSNLEEVVNGLLSNPTRRAALAQEAHRRVARYINERQVVTDYERLFEKG